MEPKNLEDIASVMGNRPVVLHGRWSGDEEQGALGPENGVFTMELGYFPGFIQFCRAKTAHLIL